VLLVSARSPKVFICEDDFLLAGALSDAVTQLGCTVAACVGNIDSALREAVNADCELAIVDLDLRGVMAYEVLDTLTQRGILYILASSANEDDIPVKYMHAPRVIKPYALESLRQAMRALAIID